MYHVPPEEGGEEEGMKKVIEFDEKCQSCDGTGLYSGMGERDGAAVVCHTCSGTGRHHFKHEYDEFIGRIKSPKVERVFEVNPGICIGTGRAEVRRYLLSDFGGMDIEDWRKGKPFPRKSEMREFTCPAWWYQSADYKKKPRWKQCNENLGGSFSQCKHFRNKKECWMRWDRENGKKES